jgi:hypothetical protein
MAGDWNDLVQATHILVTEMTYTRNCQMGTESESGGVPCVLEENGIRLRGRGQNQIALTVGQKTY